MELNQRHRPTYTHMHTSFLIKHPVINTGKKRTSSTNGTAQTERQHVDKYTLIHIYHCAQNSGLYESIQQRNKQRTKPDTLNLIEEKVEHNSEYIGTKENFLNGIPVYQLINVIPRN